MLQLMFLKGDHPSLSTEEIPSMTDPRCKKRHNKKLVNRILQKVMTTLQVQANFHQGPVYVLFALLFVKFFVVFGRKVLSYPMERISTGKVGCSKKNTLLESVPFPLSETSKKLKTQHI